jgi:hypothetical protein
LALAGAVSGCSAPAQEREEEPPVLVVTTRDNPTGPEKGPHIVSGGLGAAYWPGLGDVDPASAGFDPDEFGPFDEWGVSLALAYEGRVADLPVGSLWLGGLFSFASFENDSSFPVVTLPSGNTLDGDYTADLLMVTPTLTYRADLGVGVDGFLRGGAGYYRLALNESYDIYYDDIDDDQAFGGFIGFGLDIRVAEQIAVRIENQVHFVELEPFPDILPDEGTVDDPIYFLTIGASFRF